MLEPQKCRPHIVTDFDPLRGNSALDQGELPLKGNLFRVTLRGREGDPKGSPEKPSSWCG